MLFLAEGFTVADEAKFDQIVTEVTNELFSKPRHEPFATLSPSFNVFKAFHAVQRQALSPAASRWRGRGSVARPRARQFHTSSRSPAASTPIANWLPAWDCRCAVKPATSTARRRT